jgi:hypothetical protein
MADDLSDQQISDLRIVLGHHEKLLASLEGYMFSLKAAGFPKLVENIQSRLDSIEKTATTSQPVDDTMVNVIKNGCGIKHNKTSPRDVESIYDNYYSACEAGCLVCVESILNEAPPDFNPVKLSSNGSWSAMDFAFSGNSKRHHRDANFEAVIGLLYSKTVRPTNLW